ncbi:MAG: DUF5665 domain-containing protein [Candidatus Gracilibacteria bacterium]|nr:DUF5665 domain-containing protein [Candidatus Gracilibacteria bacterium]
MTSPRKNSPKDSELKKFNELMDSLGLAEYMDYLSSPRKIILINLLAGVMRGLGFVLGMTVVVAVITFMVSYMAALPVVGEWFSWLRDVIAG